MTNPRWYWWIAAGLILGYFSRRLVNIRIFPIPPRESARKGNMTRVREHRGSLEDSMKTSAVVADRAALLALMRDSFAYFPTFVLDPEKVKVSPYFPSPDQRIGWDVTYIVEIEGYGVWGFTDGPL
jgi:hypothetical protein